MTRIQGELSADRGAHEELVAGRKGQSGPLAATSMKSQSGSMRGLPCPATRTGRRGVEGLVTIRPQLAGLGAAGAAMMAQKPAAGAVNGHRESRSEEGGGGASKVASWDVGEVMAG